MIFARYISSPSDLDKFEDAVNAIEHHGATVTIIRDAHDVRGELILLVVYHTLGVDAERIAKLAEVLTKLKAINTDVQQHTAALKTAVDQNQPKA